MVRNVLGSLIALVGATAAVWSPFRPWYDGRHGSDVRIEDLFNGLTDNGATLFGSLVLPMVFAGLLTLVGVVLRSRLLVTLAGLVVLGFTVLWMVRQGQHSGELTAGTHGLGVGVANALGGGALLILGALVMRGRTRRVPAHEDEYDEYRDAYDDGHPSSYTPHRPPPAPWDPGPRPPRSGTRNRTDPRPAPPARPGRTRRRRPWSGAGTSRGRVRSTARTTGRPGRADRNRRRTTTGRPDRAGPSALLGRS
ncbi:hypothetical protein [Streptomyces sp. A1-5]|uniref:hypothetical protein n=1 Tax=Streptomyces sp. A1-5 TaxID=2738410 RepID=UPI001F3CA9F1|nr:hypothetical protein [Streptomyces sp. A1-5]